MYASAWGGPVMMIMTDHDHTPTINVLQLESSPLWSHNQREKSRPGTGGTSHGVARRSHEREAPEQLLSSSRAAVLLAFVKLATLEEMAGCCAFTFLAPVYARMPARRPNTGRL